MEKKPVIQQHLIPFHTLWYEIAASIGEVELPLPDSANTIAEMTRLIDGQSNPLKKCMLAVYKRSRCNHLRSPVKPLLAMDVLGEQAYRLKTRNDVDVKDIDLLEHIGLFIARKYLQTSEPAAVHRHKCQIIRLDWYKTRKANMRR